jgi:hypothetical protein
MEGLLPQGQERQPIVPGVSGRIGTRVAGLRFLDGL